MATLQCGNFERLKTTGSCQPNANPLDKVRDGNGNGCERICTRIPGIGKKRCAALALVTSRDAETTAPEIELRDSGKITYK